MLINVFHYRILLVLLASFILGQCTKAVNSTEPVKVFKEKINNPYPLPAAEYLALAESEVGEQKQSHLLSAAAQMISKGQWNQSATILTQTRELTEQQVEEKKVLLASIDVMRDKPEAALAQLSSITEASKLSAFMQIQYHEVLAQAFRSQGKYKDSIAQRIALEPLLADEESQMTNLRTLWLTLINLPPAELQVMAAEAANQSESQGWFQLVSIARQYKGNAKSLLAALDQWQTTFPNHSGNTLLPSPLDSIAHKIVSKPKKVALLLPLSGVLAGPGNAIREGFMVANKQNEDQDAIQVAVYDTAKAPVDSLYLKAIEEGAEYVVGPLTKAQVAVVAAMEHPVPTLLLNDSDVSVQDNSYLFGLSPINEATQVAMKASSKGLRKALIIAPKSDWGIEVTKAFSTQWNSKGGKIVDTFIYGPNDDLNKKMQDFLRISNSQQRQKKVQNLLGYHIQTMVSRRQDFDVIFLLAYPSKARQIMPLLKYYYSGDVPVYATSSVYAGNANALKDKDLDGVFFCDIPWVFSHQMGAKNWPEQFNSYNRLYALGLDSYSLATQLNLLILFPADGSKETNGTLYLKPTQQVARILEWGQFRQGLAHSLGERA